MPRTLKGRPNRATRKDTLPVNRFERFSKAHTSPTSVYTLSLSTRPQRVTLQCWDLLGIVVILWDHGSTYAMLQYDTPTKDAP